MSRSRAASRPPSRAERHRSRGERLPPAAELFPPEGHEVANTEGRIGLYCFNFGEVRKAEDVAAQAKNLASAPALVLAGQECTNRVTEGLGGGWLHSDLAYVGDGRHNGGDGVVICARASMAHELRTHKEYSGSHGSPAERSSQVFATVTWKRGVAGLRSLTCASLHVHRLLAKRGATSPVWVTCIRQLGVAIRASGARVLAGDLNMGLFALAGSLREMCGLDVMLVSHHREVTVSESVDVSQEVGRAAAMRFDTLGVQSVMAVFRIPCRT